MPAQFAWFDVAAKNADDVRSFYAELLGWTLVPTEDAGSYRGWIVDGGQPWAGVVEADDETAGRWVPYVQVDDLDAAAARAQELGATVVVGRTEGFAGSSVTIADPGGALVALWVPRR